MDYHAGSPIHSPFLSVPRYKHALSRTLPLQKDAALEQRINSLDKTVTDWNELIHSLIRITPVCPWQPVHLIDAVPLMIPLSWPSSLALLVQAFHPRHAP